MRFSFPSGLLKSQITLEVHNCYFWFSDDMKNEIWVFSPPNWRHILMIYVTARELSISLTKIEFVSISGSYCVRVTTLLGCYSSSQIKTESGDINETIPGYRSRSHIHCPDSPPGFPEMQKNIKIWQRGRRRRRRRRRRLNWPHCAPVSAPGNSWERTLCRHCRRGSCPESSGTGL